MSLRVFEQQEPTGPVVAIVADGAGKLVVEQSDLLFDATFLRSGNDLLIVNEAAANLHVPGYFSEGKPADIFDANGAVLRGDLIELMAGPIAPGLYAEIGTTIGASPIGQVETLDGISSVQRVDGTIETLQIGMKIFQKDVLQTEGDATLSVTFADGTIFTLAASSRMIIDELIYDPDGADNAGGFSLIQGSFVFIAGQVAKTGDMEVRTPSSTMGIRGTTVVVEVASDKGIVTSEITLAQDIDGEVGKVELRDIEGNLIANIAETDTKWVVEAVNGGIREIQRDALDELADSILVAEAFAAFRAAETRVDAGDTFVTLTDPTATEHQRNEGTDSEIDLDVDSIDEPETISPLNEVPDESEEENFDPFDEGLNTNQDAPAEQPVVFVQGNEGPVIQTLPGGNLGSVTEGEEEIETGGQVRATDPDGGETGVTWSGTSSAQYGDFTLDAQGAWTYRLDNSLADRLQAGEIITETFLAVAEDAEGATVSQSIEVTVTGTNDRPEVSTRIVFEAVENTVYSGVLTASDVDGATDALSFSLESFEPQNGAININTDGTFEYIPNAGFVGLDTFEYTVSDADGGRSFARASIVVENDPLGSSTENITIGITTQATEENPAGAITIDIDESDSTSVNLAIALDRSGSIRIAPWELLLDSVRESLEDLSDQFEGSDTSVDVQIITFATDVSTTEIFDIQDPALLAVVNPDDLAFSGGQTAWDLAFQRTGDFFFSQPASEPNYLLFVTDGIPSSGRWETPFDALVDEASGYDITVSAFGYGIFFEPGSLDNIDPSAQFLDDPTQLADAFATTPIFNPDLLSFTVELQNDDGSTTQIADESHPGLAIEGTDYGLPLATIENIAELLSDSNRINITALFDLDNDPSDSEITFFSSNVIGKADVAQTSEGLAGADLLFGSDAADSMSGGGGNDVIFGFDGNDTLSGGSGVDTLRAGEGDDVILIATATELGDAVDGEGGRDTLQIDAVGEINALIAALDISGIEALDMENAQQDTLRLSVEELIDFSDEDDTELQTLLSEALPNTRTIYGDGDDQLVIDAQNTFSVEETGTVTDSDGNELTVYAFNGSDGNPLATLGVDSDIEVTTANVVT